MLRKIILPLLLLFALSGKTQNINGIWKGKLVMEPGGCFPVYNIELQILISGPKITGKSYHYSDTTNFVKEVFEGLYDSSAKSMTIDENSVATFHIPPDCIPCIKRYALNFHTDGTARQLQEVIMVGENLGSIPPNTALMIVNAGEKRYQLYLTSDDNKNALVRFIYEKPK